MSRIVFAGTPEFARASLDALIRSGMQPVAVLTQPDRPAGRGKKLTASPVKLLAIEHNIDVLQPETLKDDETVAMLQALDADVFVVAAYGLLLPQRVLDLPKRGCINVHASLLPRWRGAAPIQAAILAGDQQTGVAIMRMEAGLDTGPVYSSMPVPIGTAENAGQLHDRLAVAGGELLVTTLPDILADSIEAHSQDDEAATYAHKFRADDARIDWSQDCDHLARLVRAYNPVPGAWFNLLGERMKCWRAEAVADLHDEPGTIIAASADGIDVACGKGGLRLHEVQRPGKARVSAAELTNQLDLSGLAMD